ncbi:GGDEF domain-containing protein [Magnetospirillum sp. XM-1]|uniref:GGDEF domain-containing protein n=1 Tax=Magnetospirillum sp. XM-1 TaxID=1663591 RepID=UPI000839A1F6|nr:GGDEF domain-containing protein [Magnetospirillum sp. XM-1]
MRPVRLQLKWTHQFQFAGYYAAKELGYYRDAGLDVEFIEGQPNVNPTISVLNGQAEFGISNSSLVIERSQGKPLVALAAIFQHSPYVLLSRKGADLQSVHDLSGKTLMVEEHADELLAYLHYEQVPLKNLRIVPHEGGVEALTGGRVDALSAYSTLEPYLMQREGVGYSLFNPRSAGIDFYGDLLFTSEAMLEKDTALVASFREASLQGWRYAISHPEEIAELIRVKYAPKLDPGVLAFEAVETRKLLAPDLVGLGYMYEGRWRHIAESFAAAGLMPRNYPLKGFLYQPAAKQDLTLVFQTLAGAGVLLLSAALVVMRFKRLNDSLRHEIARRTQLEGELRALATTDPLTGLYNRRKFFDVGEQEASLLDRFDDGFSVLMMDIDHFKVVNDRFGHAVGDEVLKRFAGTCLSVVRDVDTLARLGGEEFALLLPKADIGKATEIAERIRQLVETIAFKGPDGTPFRVTVSIGAASLVHGQDTLDTVLARADGALYAAKRDGRNRVSAATDDGARSRLIGEDLEAS